MPRGLPPHGGLSSWIMSNQKHIVLAGGGTAGHVNPLLAVAHVIRELEPEADIAVVGTAVGLERDLVPQATNAVRQDRKSTRLNSSHT